MIAELYVRVVANSCALLGEETLTTDVRRGTKSCMCAASTKVIVGGYAPANEQGIRFFEWDDSAGRLTAAGGVAGVENPSWILPDPGRQRLFAVGESAEFEGQNTGAIALVQIPNDGIASVSGFTASGGASPCHLSLAAQGQGLLVANYRGGNVGIVPLGDVADSLPAICSLQQHVGTGPNIQRQEHAHAHSFIESPNGGIAYAADLGCDAVFAYEVGAEGNALTPRSDLTYAADPGAGPRHLTFSADGDFAYLLNELSSTIDVLQVGPDGGLTKVQSCNLLPAAWGGANISAEVLLHPNGRWLYGSNRGHDSLTVFAVDSSTGRLTDIDHVSTRGRTPRNFRISPDGLHLIVANQDSDSLAVFTIDPAEGIPRAHGDLVSTPRPTCVRFW